MIHSSSISHVHDSKLTVVDRTSFTLRFPLSAGEPEPRRNTVSRPDRPDTPRPGPGQDPPLSKGEGGVVTRIMRHKRHIESPSYSPVRFPKPFQPKNPRAPNSEQV